MLEPYLEDLEKRIDPEVEDQLQAEWQAFLENKFSGAIFSPRRVRAAEAQIAWPKVLVNDALNDFEQMTLQQLGACSAALAEGSGALLMARANYGTCILPSLFGAEIFYMDREIDTLPTSRPIAGGSEALIALIEKGIPDPEQGMGAQIFETTRKTLDLFKNYPKIARYVSLYHPDTQGPMDVCELLWGSRLFLDIYDQPELVHALLKLITATYTRFLRRWFALVSGAPYSPQPSQRFAPHWALLHRGVIMLRDDSAMNFSPRMFEQFIEPYDQQLLDEFNGGAVHFCGKGSHYIRRMGQMRGVYGIQLTQPEYNDMEHIYQHTVDKGIPLLALEPREAERTLAEGRSLHGLVHCWQPLKELQ